MNTFLLLLANITATIALPAISFDSAALLATLAVAAIALFAAMDYGILKIRPPRRSGALTATP